MPSGRSHEEYTESLGHSRGLFASDADERRRATFDRAERIRAARETVTEEKTGLHRDTSGVYDPKLVKSRITSPAPGVKRAYVVLIDNSGSNRAIARHLKESSGYLAAVLNTLDPESQIALIYFSDHGDGKRLMQEVDFVHPNEEGDKVIHSTTAHVHDAHGYDPPEAIECALWRACEIDFRDADERHLILVTDVVAHGMGMHPDDGCTDQRDWRTSLQRVSDTYTSFKVVGCGSDRRVGHLQEQFIAPERVAFDLIDLSNIREEYLRQGITGNAILFLIARQLGRQGVELFLSALYEKWLSEPIFGQDTDRRAREMIQRFSKYLEYPKDEVAEILHKVIPENVL